MCPEPSLLRNARRSSRYWIPRFLIVLSLLLLSARLSQAKDQLFRFKESDAQSVGLVGEFNGWKPTPMKKDGDGSWTASVSLPPGTYGYKFLVNGTDWTFDPENSNRKKVDGIVNSAIEVTAANNTSSPANSLPSPKSELQAPSRPPLDFNVLAERKRFEFNRTGTQSTVTTREKWGYKVTMENKTFKPVGSLEIQYREFKLDDTVRGPSSLVGIGGSTTLGSLETGQRFTFETAPVEVERSDLRPNWSYSDGGKARVKDALVGIWIRVLSGSEVVFECQTPSDLKSKASGNDEVLSSADCPKTGVLATEKIWK